MSGNNSIQNGEWIRLNVGGKVFQTTKDTLSQHPESFLACLVIGDIPSEKDETGAYLIDRDPEHFRIILNYLRSPVLNLDGNKNILKELLCEADFYGIQTLVDDIYKIMKSPINRTEVIIISPTSDTYFAYEKRANGMLPDVCYYAYILMSETQDDYEVLQALRQKITIQKRPYYYDNSKRPSEKTMYFIKNNYPQN